MTATTTKLLCVCRFRNDGHKLDEWLEMREEFDVKSIIK